ncbi:MAG TPA: hypothetical protein VGH40_11805 [Roseiarcus sp.]|jgi:hypothetical protein
MSATRPVLGLNGKPLGIIEGIDDARDPHGHLRLEILSARGGVGGAPSPPIGTAQSDLELGRAAALTAMGKRPGDSARQSSEFERGRAAALTALGKAPRASTPEAAEIERGRQAFAKAAGKAPV